MTGDNVKIERKKTVQVDVTRIFVHTKPCDSGTYRLVDAQNEPVCEHDGYVPSFFPEGGDDYLVLDIELATGKILNWKPPTARELQVFVEKTEEES